MQGAHAFNHMHYILLVFGLCVISFTARIESTDKFFKPQIWGMLQG